MAISVISIPFHNIAIKRHTLIEKIDSFILVYGRIGKKKILKNLSKNFWYSQKWVLSAKLTEENSQGF